MKLFTRILSAQIIVAASVAFWLVVVDFGFGQAKLPDLPPLRNEPLSQPVQVVTVSQAEIEAKRKQIAAAKDLDEATKKKALTHLTAATVFSADVIKLATRADEDDRAARAATNGATQLREKLKELRELKPQPPSMDDKLADLEQRRGKRELDLGTSRSELSRLGAESARRANARKKIREELLGLPRDIERLSQEIARPVNKEPPALAAARIMELTAQRAMRQLQLRALQSELSRFDAEEASDTLRLQKDIQDRIVTLAEAELRLLDERVKVLRDEAALAAVRKAHEEVARATPRLKPYAERNQELAQSAQKLNPKLAAAEEKLRKTKEEYEALRQQFEKTKQKVTSIGLTNSVGAMLRKRRSELPDTSTLKQAIRRRQETIEDAQFELFGYEEERALDRTSMLARMVDPQADQENVSSEQAAKFVLDRRDEYLDAIIRAYNSYFDTLVESSTTEQQLVRLAKTYVDYVDERVLWTRSGRPLYRHWAVDESSYWFLEGSRWQTAAASIVADFRGNLAIWLIAFVAFIALIVSGQRFRRQIARLGAEAESENCATFKPTRHVLVLTLIVSLTWPGVLGFLGWRLTNGEGADVLSLALGNALRIVVIAMGPLEILRHVCRSRGLAASHFGISHGALQFLRSNLRFLIAIGVPLLFVTASLHAIDPMHGDDADERVCFVVLSLVLCQFLRRVLHPVRGPLTEYIARHEGGWVDRLKYVWYWLASLCPLIFAALAVVGYYYTAIQLSWRLYGSVCLIIGVLLVAALITRLLLTRRRQLAKEQQDAETSAVSNDPEIAEFIPAESEEDNLEDHQEQSRRLLGVFSIMLALIGLWLIWVDVLPALKVLDQYPVFGKQATTATASSTSTPATPAPIPSSPPAKSEGSAPKTTEASTATSAVTNPISVSDVILAILILVAIFASARDIPGLMEMTILQKLPLDASLRYAITTIAKYAIFMVGIVAVGSTLGLRWNQIQWLATALTFGLAFGLQEIFANFVAGLIILFERPVRVGDVITIGDVTGVVSRVRMRATTITDWDRKDYIVPNKEFITGRLLNWTLSDQVNRVVVDVGVAYGSDTELARKILLDIAREHPLILDEPETRATFEGFGDSTLNFRLRTFLPALKHRLKVIHELHSAIHQRFAEHGIEIAFPQRDLHIHSDDQDLGGPGFLDPAKGPDST